MDRQKSENPMFFLDVINFNRDFTRFIESSLKFGPKEGVKIGINLRFFLMYISSKKTVTYYQLSQELPYDSSFISRTLKKLEDLKLINKEVMGNKKIISLTEDGNKKIEFKDGRKKLFKTIENQGIPDKELMEFFATMKKLSKILKRESGVNL